MPVGYELNDAVAVITIDRPEVLNAFDDALGQEMLEAVTRAGSDADVRCIVITGAGRAFSAGEDLGALADGYDKGIVPSLGQTLVDRYNPLIRAVRNAPKPVLAAVNGVAAGAGASLAFACDFRIASEHAKFVLAFIKVGLVPDSGAIWFLSRMVGAAKAWELAALGNVVGAEEALGLGLTHRVAGADDFEDAWRDWAAQLAAGPTRAYALTKELVNSAGASTLEDALEAEVKAQAEAGATQDHLAGVRAFLGKRSPEFRGQ